MSEETDLFPTDFMFTIEELTLLYKFLSHEYIRDLELRKVVDRIAKIVESYHA